MFPENDKKLKGFIWRENEKPKNKNDIFINDGKIDTTPVKKGGAKKDFLLKSKKENLKSKEKTIDLKN